MDEEVLLDFERRFSGDLILLRASRLVVSQLKGNELNGLCLLISYSEKSKFDTLARNNELVAQIARDYAASIRDEVMSEIRRRQATLGGESCDVGGIGGICPFKNKTLCEEDA
ncbi:MAG: hypothetical protein AAGI44_16815 [Pseudomonadota bacterium]